MGSSAFCMGLQKLTLDLTHLQNLYFASSHIYYLIELCIYHSDVKRIKMLKENCRESGSTSYFNATHKYKTSSPSSGRSVNNNNNNKSNDSNVNQFQELNNYRMTNWKNLVRTRENSRSKY